MALTTVGDIRINHPGDGAWVMGQVEGVFTPETDHVILRVSPDGERLGGFAMTSYLGASMAVHMAGDAPGWCSRTLMWMLFHYCFIQLGCRKLVAPCRSNNYTALALDMRAGWKFEAIIRDLYPDAHLVILTMERSTCRWLRIKPDGWMPGVAAREMETA